METCVVDKLDGLVLVGGQYTMADAAMLAEYAPRPAGLGMYPSFRRDSRRARNGAIWNVQVSCFARVWHTCGGRRRLNRRLD
jgi:6-phosphofructokinase